MELCQQHDHILMVFELIASSLQESTDKEHERFLLSLLRVAQSVSSVVIEDNRTNLSYRSHLKLLDEYIAIMECCLIRRSDSDDGFVNKEEQDWSFVMKRCHFYDCCDLSQTSFAFRRALLHLHHSKIISLMIPRDHHTFSHSDALVLRANYFANLLLCT